jgi:glycosyltransferase involved in cell wall biosynthesis
MRFSFFDFIHNMGGAQIANIRLISNIKDGASHSFNVVDVFGTCDNFNDFVKQKNIDHYTLLNEKIVSIADEKNLLRLAAVYFRIFRKAAKLFSLHKPDVIWTSSEKGLYTLWLSKVFSRGKYKIIFYAHGYDRLFKCKWLFYLLCRYQIYGVWVLSESFRQIFGSRKVPLSKIFVIPNVVDEELVQKAAVRPDADIGDFKDEYVNILLPASLIRDKGILDAVAAMEILENMGSKVKLFIAGAFVDLAFHKVVNDQIDQLKLRGRVILLGWRKDISNLMAQASIVLLPSYSEGMPLVILESMALGKPIIATPVGAIPEMIADGHNGYLVDVGNPEAIAHAINKIINQDEINRLGENGRLIFLAKYTVEVQQVRFTQALEKCTG